MPDPVINPEVPTTPEVTTGGAPSSFSSFRDAFAAKFEGVPADLDEDTLVSSIAHATSRASLLQDNEDENTLRAMREAYAFRQQNASDWEKFQQWKQSQAQDSSGAQAAKEVAAEIQRKFNPVRLDPDVMPMLEQDEQTGLWRAKLPELAPRAEEANRAMLYRRQLAEQMYNDPYAFGEELVRPYFENEKKAILQQIEDLKSMINPLKQSAEQQALSNFEYQHASLLFQPAEEGKEPALTPAGKAYEAALAKGLKPQDALDIAKMFATSGSPEPKVETPTPAEVKKTFLAKAKAAGAKKTDQPTDISNTIRTAIETKTPQSTTRLTPRARWRAAAEQAQAELIEGSAS